MVSPMSIAYLMGMLANGADGKTQQEILKAIGCEGVSVKELNDCYKALMLSAGKLDKQDQRLITVVEFLHAHALATDCLQNLLLSLAVGTDRKSVV